MLRSNIAIVYRKPYKLTTKESKKEPDSKHRVFLFNILNDFKILINCFAYGTFLTSLLTSLYLGSVASAKKALLYTNCRQITDYRNEGVV